MSSSIPMKSSDTLGWKLAVIVFSKGWGLFHCCCRIGEICLNIWIWCSGGFYIYIYIYLISDQWSPNKVNVIINEIQVTEKYSIAMCYYCSTATSSWSSFTTLQPSPFWPASPPPAIHPRFADLYCLQYITHVQWICTHCPQYITHVQWICTHCPQYITHVHTAYTILHNTNVETKESLQQDFIRRRREKFEKTVLFGKITITNEFPQQINLLFKQTCSCTVFGVFLHFTSVFTSLHRGFYIIQINAHCTQSDNDTLHLLELSDWTVCNSDSVLLVCAGEHWWYLYWLGSEHWYLYWLNR